MSEIAAVNQTKVAHRLREGQLHEHGLLLADPADLDEITRTFAEAFAEDPLMQWMLRGGRGYEFGLRAFFEFVLKAEGFPNHRVIRNAEGTAFAIWMPSDEYTVEPENSGKFAFWKFLLDSCSLWRIHRFYHASRLSESKSPDFQHYYLHFLCVRASSRGRNIGNGFVRDTLQLFDGLGVSTCLEVSNHRNLSFYGRLGYRVIGRFSYSEGCPEIIQLHRMPYAAPVCTDSRPPAEELREAPRDDAYRPWLGGDPTSNAFSFVSPVSWIRAVELGGRHSHATRSVRKD
jgi:ribosomal protein S18 acetylase RimI-like enzyme